MTYFENDWSGLPAATRFAAGKRAIIVTDANVAPLYLDAVCDALSPIFPYLSSHIIPAGETSKSFDGLGGLLAAFQHTGLDKSSAVFALGGGVVGDITGLAASLYMRGIPWAVLPTTLLAMSDSAIGGKTAVDFGGTKNLVGSFHQPAAIYANLATLATLPHTQYISGLAEAIKYGIIKDHGLFDAIWQKRDEIARRDTAALATILPMCADIKSRIVALDERDVGARQVLNYGHTFGHAIEALCGFDLPHGHCVALGMICAAAFSHKMGGMSDGNVKIIHNTLNYFELPTKFPGKYNVSPLEIFRKMQEDKKAADGAITLIISHEIGNVDIIRNAKKAAIIAAIEEIF